jgi:dephospho-CoA kinase
VVTAAVTRVALTGGIATGKSYCLTRFVELGAPTIDADQLARQAIAPGTPGFDAVLTRFGRAVQKRDGGLDRDALARLVFSDDAARRDLETIVHPVVYAAIKKWFDGLSSAGGRPQAAIADVPLLFETGRERDFDFVIVAACRPEQQLERLRARGMTEEDAQKRINAQIPIDQKAARANFLIDTSDTEAQTNLQVLQVWEKLNRR